MNTYASVYARQEAEAKRRYEEWIAAVKAGDEVAIDQGSGKLRYELVKVVRTTKSQILVSGFRCDRRFRRKNGREVGRSYGPTLVQITDKILARIESGNLRTRFSEVTAKVEKLTDAEIKAMLTALEQVRAESAE